VAKDNSRPRLFEPQEHQAIDDAIDVAHRALRTVVRAVSLWQTTDAEKVGEARRVMLLRVADLTAAVRDVQDAITAATSQGEKGGQ
jgi:hypothetical protein